MLFSDSKNPFIAISSSDVKSETKSFKIFNQFLEDSLSKVPVNKKIFKSNKLFKNYSILDRFSS